MQEVRHVVALIARQLLPLAALIGALRHDAARDLRRRGADRRDDEGVEGFERHRALVAGKKIDRAVRQRRIVVEPALDLDHERRRPGDATEKGRKRRDSLRRAADGAPGEVGGLALPHEPGRGGEPVEREVVEHDGLAVARVLHVAFDRESGRDRGLGGGERVLDRAGARVMQPAMGDRTCDEPVGCAHRTSNIASTSTAASSGSSATPIVERACRPRSPSTATIRSEAPFITCASAAKLGSALMKPPSRTQRTMPSRSPIAARIWASTLMAQSRAAAWPASSATSRPSLPLWPSAILPSGPKQIWPETTTRFPVRTKGK